MQYLYAPWRGQYAQNSASASGQESPFTQMFASDQDADNFILKRLTYHGVILNQYPYNPGHLLIVPYRQVSRLDALSAEEQFEFMRATTESTQILEAYINNAGTNVGLNLGDRASGGSILYHIHMHIIPRWHGDTSFLPLMAETKVLSEDLRTVYQRLAEPFQRMTINVPTL